MIALHQKKYEFRKYIFKKPVDFAYIYATSPVKKIVGYFKIGQIIEDNPENLWRILGDSSGMEKQDFYTYFNGDKKGFAIEIIDLTTFNCPIDPQKVIPNFLAPQSFKYVDIKDTNLITARAVS